MIKNFIVTGSKSLIGSSILNISPHTGLELNDRLGDYRLILNSNLGLNTIENLLINQDSEIHTFFHCAWIGSNPANRNNNINYENLDFLSDIIKLAKRFGVKKFVDCGSQAELNMPETAYAKAKTEFAQKAKDLCHKNDIEYCHTQIFSVYGPMNLMKKVLVKIVITALLNRKSPPLTKCEQIWDFLYSEDCGRAFHLIAEKGINGKTYQLGSGTHRPLREYVEEIRDIINKDIHLEFGTLPYYPNQAMSLCADISELTADTGFEPYYSFEEGIKRIYQEYAIDQVIKD